MRYKSVISVERIVCEAVSDAAILEYGALAVPDEVVQEPIDRLLVAVSSFASSQQLAAFDLGEWQAGQMCTWHQVVYTEDAQKWPLLALQFLRVNSATRQPVLLGKVLFRYVGNCFFEWQIGKDTGYSGEEAKSGISRFCLNGDGARYALFLRAVVLDTAFETWP